MVIRVDSSFSILFSGWCSLLFAAIFSGLNQRKEEFLCIRVVSSCWYPKLISYYLFPFCDSWGSIILGYSYSLHSVWEHSRHAFRTRFPPVLMTVLGHLLPFHWNLTHITPVGHSTAFSLESDTPVGLLSLSSPILYRSLGLFTSELRLISVLKEAWTYLGISCLLLEIEASQGSTHAKHVLYHWSLKAGF